MSATIDPNGLIASPTMSFAKGAQPNTVVNVTGGQQLTVTDSGQHTTYNVQGSSTDTSTSIAFLTIADPKDFKGSVNLLNGPDQLRLSISADSYTIDHNTLTLYKGNAVVDKLDLTIANGLTPFVVGPNTSFQSPFVIVGAGFMRSAGSGLVWVDLPVHT